MMMHRLCRLTLRANGFRNNNAAALSRQQVRAYLGGAGDMISRRDNANKDEVAKREQELWDRAQPRYEEIMERHLRLPTAEKVANDSTGMNEEERNLAVRKKRLVYRSKQRGWLEVDLLLGTWAAENVSNLSVAELDEFEKFVNLETIDIYNVLTLRTDVPEDMRTAGGDGLVERIAQWAKESPLGKADQEKYVEVKTKNNLI
ncbi:succinate dehydrogenase assembly factor 2 [Skeletonema marinoi]|jgi:succinate dehydrogenase assembly factor 2|uniref:Succinate dehydrogenase assembly factor 2 n=1 Tax=Skeletonema marinoi TaxID=267567 RepID=A0AAD8YPU3_9STRA|nr:succinate dehydrogenase assembly factor 2 [Skeletonema marinoi]|mmetsp:Transcript_37413/g.76455  ORF Transcript_37413/g.76455 Transcript_37413/m.76455 type:complete len:203 (+) Transcript_37413:48-656(+)|eukprot:scaffold2222_cov112-Skeletonema_marinoi.AAC.2